MQSAACQLTEIPSGKREQVICEREEEGTRRAASWKNILSKQNIFVFCLISPEVLAQKWLSRPQSYLECLGKNISGNHTYSYK